MARDDLEVGVAPAHIRVIERDVRGLPAADHHEGLTKFPVELGGGAVEGFEPQPERAAPTTLVQKLIDGRFAHVRIARTMSSFARRRPCGELERLAPET